MKKILFIAFIFLLAEASFAQSRANKWEEAKSLYLSQQHIFLFTETGRVTLDSNEFKALSAKWIKSINMVQLSADDPASAQATASVFVALKKKYLKKYLTAHPNLQNNK